MRKGGGSYSTYTVSMMTLGTRLYSVLTVSSLHTKEIQQYTQLGCLYIVYLWVGKQLYKLVKPLGLYTSLYRANAYMCTCRWVNSCISQLSPLGSTSLYCANIWLVALKAVNYQLYSDDYIYHQLLPLSCMLQLTMTAKWRAVLSSDPGRLTSTSPWVSSVKRRSNRLFCLWLTMAWMGASPTSFLLLPSTAGSLKSSTNAQMEYNCLRWSTKI